MYSLEVKNHVKNWSPETPEIVDYKSPLKFWSFHVFSKNLFI